MCDEHVPLLRQAPQANAKYAPDVNKILAVMDDLPSHIGRRGRVWVSQDRTTGSYSAFWDDDDWLEQGPEGVARETALAWAALRADHLRLTEHRV